jgi:hypothetical protein
MMARVARSRLHHLRDGGLLVSPHEIEERILPAKFAPERANAQPFGVGVGDLHHRFTWGSEFEHAPQAPHIEHVGGQRDLTGVGDARGP